MSEPQQKKGILYRYLREIFPAEWRLLTEPRVVHSPEPMPLSMPLPMPVSLTDNLEQLRNTHFPIDFEEEVELLETQFRLRQVYREYMARPDVQQHPELLPLELQNLTIEEPSFEELETLELATRRRSEGRLALLRNTVEGAFIDEHRFQAPSEGATILPNLDDFSVETDFQREEVLANCDGITANWGMDLVDIIEPTAMMVTEDFRTKRRAIKAFISNSTVNIPHLLSMTEEVRAKIFEYLFEGARLIVDPEEMRQGRNPISVENVVTNILLACRKLLWEGLPRFQEASLVLENSWGSVNLTAVLSYPTVMSVQEVWDMEPEHAYDEFPNLQVWVGTGEYHITEEFAGALSEIDAETMYSYIVEFLLRDNENATLLRTIAELSQESSVFFLGKFELLRHDDKSLVRLSVNVHVVKANG